MAMSLQQGKTGSDLVLLRLDGPLRKGAKVVGEPQPLVATEADDAFPAVSPDGREASLRKGIW